MSTTSVQPGGSGICGKRRMDFGGATALELSSSRRAKCRPVCGGPTEVPTGSPQERMNLDPIDTLLHGGSPLKKSESSSSPRAARRRQESGRSLPARYHADRAALCWDGRIVDHYGLFFLILVSIELLRRTPYRGRFGCMTSWACLARLSPYFVVCLWLVGSFWATGRWSTKRSQLDVIMCMQLG